MLLSNIRSLAKVTESSIENLKKIQKWTKAILKANKGLAGKKKVELPVDINKSLANQAKNAKTLIALHPQHIVTKAAEDIYKIMYS